MMESWNGIFRTSRSTRTVETRLEALSKHAFWRRRNVGKRNKVASPQKKDGVLQELPTQAGAPRTSCAYR